MGNGRSNRQRMEINTQYIVGDYVGGSSRDAFLHALFTSSIEKEGFRVH